MIVALTDGQPCHYGWWKKPAGAGIKVHIRGYNNPKGEHTLCGLKLTEQWCVDKQDVEATCAACIMGIQSVAV